MWFKRDKKLWMDDLMGCFLWQELREIAAHHKENDTFPANWGKQPYNTKKNRYRDIVPCEWNHKFIMHIPPCMYTCIMIILYIINLVDAPLVHMVQGLIFYLFNINNKAHLKQKISTHWHYSRSSIWGSFCIF